MWWGNNSIVFLITGYTQRFKFESMITYAILNAGLGSQDLGQHGNAQKQDHHWSWYLWTRMDFEGNDHPKPKNLNTYYGE